jgi:hypothetical protein
LKKVDLVYLSTGDWVGVYIDGKLVHNHHDVEPEDLLKWLGIDVLVWNVDMESNYPMPENIEDIIE